MKTHTHVKMKGYHTLVRMEQVQLHARNIVVLRASVCPPQ